MGGGKMKAVKFEIKPLLTEPGSLMDISFGPEQELNIDDYEAYHFTSPLSFKGDLLSEDSGILILEGRLSIDYEAECVRCLAPIKDTFECDVREYIYPLDYKTHMQDLWDLSDEEAEDLPDPEMDPDEFLFHDGSRVDLTKALEDLLILNLPISPYCSDDCPGLCPVCGRRKDDPNCHCDDENISDSPFAKLKDLL
jgi:uncharacterized protein